MSPIIIDPALFRSDAIRPDTAEFNHKIETLLNSMPSAMDVGAPIIRERRKNGEGLLGYQPAHDDARWETATALGREVPVRVFTPKADASSVLIHIHGGGHCFGSADAQDQTLAEIANRLCAHVVSVEYRLAPENPYPAAPDDCETAALWVCENARTMFGTDKIALMGESAGAHLCAVTILRLKKRLGECPISAANLIYGQFDATGLPAVHAWGDRNLVLTTPLMYWFSSNFLPPDDFSTEAKRDPDISPINGQLENLCPALFTCGTLDPLIDDTVLMSYRWGAAGNDVEMKLFPGGIHAFNMIPGCNIGEEANEFMLEWLDRQLNG